MFKKSILIILIFVSSSYLFSEGLSSKENADSYSIRTITYTIKGRTRESVLRHYLDIKPGKIFQSKEDLKAYLDDKIQMLENLRPLAESSITPHYSKDPDHPERMAVDLNIYAKDSWNFLALPYAKYDSNNGFLLSLRGRNYNFFGSLETLKLNFDYLKPDSGSSGYSMNGSFNLPFYLWDYNWMVSFEENVGISSEDPVYVYTKAGLSLGIPLDLFTWQASINQCYYLNEDGTDDADGSYMKTNAAFGTSIHTGVRIPPVGELIFSPEIITSYAYKPFGTLSEERRGYELGGQYGISAGRINWLGNLRDGATLSIKQNMRYNFTRSIWLSNTDLELQYHKSFGWGGVSSRVMGTWLYNSTDEDIGEPIRGILDKRLNGNAAVFVNLDFPVKVWTWFLSRWIEGQISPFFDYALVKPDDGSFSLNDGWYGGGLEGLVYFKAARSICLRVSLGVDLQALSEGVPLRGTAPRDGAQIYEIFIGLGHHY